MSKDNEELFRLGTSAVGDRTANQAAFNQWQQTNASNGLTDGAMGWLSNRIIRQQQEKFAVQMTGMLDSSLRRIVAQLEADLADHKATHTHERYRATLRREAMELEQSAIRDLLLEEIEAGRLDREAVNAIYQEELQAERDALVEAMKGDPEHAATLEADIALVDEMLNSAIDTNAYADEIGFIAAHGELPTWPAGKPAPKDYRHPGPLMRVMTQSELAREQKNKGEPHE
ncbi:hypothetical protein [Sedimenticola hydrogenitrophicus]|uniref:hypothetical protein n=1 Tax=Sedimenticola hydrogenitrophicus TaxID=2967975 RepID=UPI0023AF4240|nr:hypothetical protein [Sedimenticola hydrogenitrophicus]